MSTTGKVEIITTSKPAPREWTQKRNARKARFPSGGDKEGYQELANYAHPQCQNPRCLSFAASFGPTKVTLMGTTTPLAFTERHTHWFEIRERAARAEKQYSRPIDYDMPAAHERVQAIENKGANGIRALYQDEMQRRTIEARDGIFKTRLNLFHALSEGSEKFFYTMYGQLEQLLDKLPDLEMLKIQRTSNYLMPRNTEFPAI
ncbi:MAG: hypothetical protein Q9221_001512 [Calogaya cf. arnoldii]